MTPDETPDALHPDAHADAALAALWTATGAPIHDFAFALAIEARIARRALFIDLAVRLTAAAAVTALIAALAPAFFAGADALAGQLNAAGPVLAAFAVLAAVIVRLVWPAPDGPGGELEDGGEALG